MPSADSCIYLTLLASTAPSANLVNRLVSLVSIVRSVSFAFDRLAFSVSLRIFLSFPILQPPMLLINRAIHSELQNQ